MIFLALFAGWILCSLYSAGTTFAYYQGRWPTIAVQCRRADLNFALVMSLGGPLTALMTLFYCDFNKYGWRIR